MFNELGPLRIVNETTIVRNEHGWNKVAHVVFIDQPVGVGFSYASPDRSPTSQYFAKDEATVAANFYQALVSFYTKFPEHKSKKLFIAGESYAGHYIPAIADYIVEQNAVRENKIPLEGVAIGDGLVDALIQRLIQVDQAYYAGILGWHQKQQLHELQAMCAQYIQQGNTVERDSPCDIMSDYMATAYGALNVYDIRKIDPSFPAAPIANYLNRLDVQLSIHAVAAGTTTPVNFVRCSPTVYDNLKTDILISFKNTVKKLTHHTKVLIYNGNFDLKDGPVGTVAW